jgi:hypothetical protein
MKKKFVKRKVKSKSKAKRASQPRKRWFYWIADEECGKYYFDSEATFLGFLQQNDPVECGAQQMTRAEFDKLPDFA